MITMPVVNRWRPAVNLGIPPYSLGQNPPITLSQDEAWALLDRVRDARERFLAFEADGLLTDCMRELRKPENWVDVRADIFDVRLKNDLERAQVNDTIEIAEHRYRRAQDLIACVEEIEGARTTKKWLLAAGVLAVGAGLYFLFRPKS